MRSLFADLVTPGLSLVSHWVHSTECEGGTGEWAIGLGSVGKAGASILCLSVNGDRDTAVSL